MIANRHVVIVGVGRVGLALLEELPESWTVTAVDIRAEALEKLPETRGDQTIQRIQGDATSRLVLERAGLSKRTAVAITTDNDTTSLEVARVIRTHFQVNDLVCMLDTVDEVELERARLLRSEVTLQSRAAARIALNHLSGAEPQSLELQLDRGEIRMFQVLPGSAAIGRPLKELQPRRWLAAAVYREEALIVPHGETVLEAGDRVMLVGEPAVIDSVGQFIHGSEPIFPTQYGAHIGRVGTQEATNAETRWLMERTYAEDEVAIDPQHIDPAVLSPEDTALVLAQRKIGLLVMDDAPIPLFSRLGLTGSSRKKLVTATRVPVLIARSNRPYRKILLAVGVDQSLNAVSVVAMDIAQQVDASLTVLTVVPPSLSAGEESLQPLRELPGRVAALGRLHGLEVEQIIEEGNPIHQIRRRAADFDLLVVGYSRRRYNTIFTPDVSLHLLHQTPCSVLFVPWNPAGH